MNTSIEEVDARDEAEPLVCLPPTVYPLSREGACFDCASFLCCILVLNVDLNALRQRVTSVSSTHAEPGNHQVSSFNSLYESVEIPHSTVLLQDGPILGVVANASASDSCRCRSLWGLFPRAYEQCAPEEARWKDFLPFVRDSPLPELLSTRRSSIHPATDSIKLDIVTFLNFFTEL